jgi:hypothetical protein
VDGGKYQGRELILQFVGKRLAVLFTCFSAPTEKS